MRLAVHQVREARGVRFRRLAANGDEFSLVVREQGDGLHLERLSLPVRRDAGRRAQPPPGPLPPGFVMLVASRSLDSCFGSTRLWRSAYWRTVSPDLNASFATFAALS